MNGFLSVAGLALSLLACLSDPISSTVPASPDIVPVPAYRFLSLGDSYTIGESVPVSERWSVQLAAMLREEGVPLQVPTILAQTGWTTAELQFAIQQAKDTSTYDLVSLLIGVNNQYRGQSLGRYRTEFKELLDLSTHFARGRPERVFVLSIPDWGVTPAGLSRRQKTATEIDAFNTVAKEECAKAGILFIDITPLSRTALNNPSLIASDNLHFSGKMYKLWAEEAFLTVKRMVTK
ncbi:SGNH/GDSL hydrolase family protein [Rhabdobacter roseus]|uniref:Lysophospholipase L1-like esterase n=1 Tax=Rhabdobacter roseus TaxID=1655419 RepID=A0A840TV16_9BACT|nr:SGNH/GDSL hydrolase family protein [Rhabdobacter roseus]MBB5286745.1 lysophospholipase L1-like esterase [Rhabdobacter roseus]